MKTATKRIFGWLGFIGLWVIVEYSMLNLDKSIIWFIVANIAFILAVILGAVFLRWMFQ